MIEALSGLGYGIIGLAVVIGIGTVVLIQLGTTISGCAAGHTYNTTTLTCLNATYGDAQDPSGATSTVNTVTGYLGTSSGSLASWIPVIIVLVIGMLFLGAFMGKRGKTYS